MLVLLQLLLLEMISVLLRGLRSVAATAAEERNNKRCDSSTSTPFNQHRDLVKTQVLATSENPPGAHEAAHTAEVTMMTETRTAGHVAKQIS